MNVSLLFSFERKHYGVDISLFLLIHTNEISLSLYIDRFFHILQISYEIKSIFPCVFEHNASSSLHVTDLETMYLSRFI